MRKEIIYIYNNSKHYHQIKIEAKITVNYSVDGALYIIIIIKRTRKQSNKKT